MGKKIIKKDVLKRAFIVTIALVVFGFGTGIFRLGYIQLVKGEEYKVKAESNQLKDTTVTAERGVIYDANMEVLAKSASVWKIYVIPNKFRNINEDAKKTIINELVSVLDVSEKTVNDKISHTAYNYLVVKNKVEKAEKDKIKKFMSTYYETSDKKKIYYSSYIGIDPDVKRYYPYSNLASNVIGFTGADDVGLSGLESKYNSILTGVNGRIVSLKNSGEESAIEYESVNDAKQGTSLVLTIDSTIQRYLEDALDSCYEDSKCKTCYGIVMDTQTGAILAMSTKADYDLNNPYTITNKETAKEIESMPDGDKKNAAYSEARNNQWNNHAITDTYEPGSVFKLITMAAGIEEGVVDYNKTTYNCSGSIKIADRTYYCHNHAGHGLETMAQGLSNSCNPFFITIGQRLGVDKFYKYFEGFGFTDKTGIDLPGEVTPKVGTSYFAKEDMTKVNLASCSFGQSFQVSAIQMITAVNAIANGGKLMKPYVVAKTLDDNGNILSETEPTVKRQVISSTTAENIKDAMKMVVTTGTGKNAYVAGYSVAGKTGTSDKLLEVNQTVASFAGFAPADDPKVSIIIVADEPQGSKSGSSVAAPAVAQVFENTLSYLNVERNYSDNEKDNLDVGVPNVVNVETDTARMKLKNAGFTVKVVGSGTRVVSQCPSFGQYIPQDGIVVLYTDKKSSTSQSIVPNFKGMTINEAGNAAVNAGVNIKISGNSLTKTGMIAYRQSVDANSKVDSGSTITVMFKASTGVADD